MRQAKLILWEEFEAEYAKLFPSHTGVRAKPYCMSLVPSLTKKMKKLSDK
jgi:hypothetical protein